MLENIGRRYLVEHGETEEGWEYDLYSDGWLVQHYLLKESGETGVNDYTKFKLTLPKAFNNIDYEVFPCVRVPTTQYGNFLYCAYSAEDSSNITIYLNPGNTANSYYYNGIAIIAQGYAA